MVQPILDAWAERRAADCRAMRRAATARRRPTRCWRATAGAGARSARGAGRMTSRRCRPQDLGCWSPMSTARWSPTDKVLTDARRAAVAALARARHRLRHHQQPAAARHAHAGRALEHHTPIAGFNGGAVRRRRDLAIIEQHLLPPDVARRAVELSAPMALEAWVFSGNDWLLQRSGERPMSRSRSARCNSSRPSWRISAPALDHAAKIVGVSDDLDAAGAMRGRHAPPRSADGATVARSQPYYLDITHPLANKGAAVLALARAAGRAAGRDRRHRRRRQRRRDVRAERAQHRHGQCRRRRCKARRTS